MTEYLVPLRDLASNCVRCPGPVVPIQAACSPIQSGYVPGDIGLDPGEA
jgi:hypothetical protein